MMKMLFLSVTLKDNKSSHDLKNVLFRFDFVDLWKTIKSDKNGFTWCDVTQQKAELTISP